MSDFADLVKRLRAQYVFDGKFIHADAADAIETLTRERDEAWQKYVDANEARIDAEKVRDAAIAEQERVFRECCVLKNDLSAAIKERDEARAGNHADSEHEPTWAQLTAYWKERADKAEAERDAAIALLREAKAAMTSQRTRSEVRDILARITAAIG